MKLKLHTPGVREMEHRRRWLAQPETMAYNRGQLLDAEGYDCRTGCIDFPPRTGAGGARCGCGASRPATAPI